MDHWEAYYRSGALAVCPGETDSNYAREMRALWVEFFGSLPDRSRVLDVGTGNGAVALIAAETAAQTGRKLEVHATDLAMIDPRKVVTGRRELFDAITFHAGVATEELPFDDEAFDAISSQFAIEYTDLPRSLAEIRRVLKRDGKARFSMHHARSQLSQNAHASLQECGAILQSERIHRRLREFVALDAAAAKGGPNERRRAARAWQALGDALRRLPRPTPPGGHVTAVTLDAVRSLLQMRKSVSPAILEREVERVERDLRASARRLRDMISASTSESQMVAFVARADDAGLEVVSAIPQYQAGNDLVAWQVDLRPAGAAGPAGTTAVPDPL